MCDKSNKIRKSKLKQKQSHQYSKKQVSSNNITVELLKEFVDHLLYKMAYRERSLFSAFGYYMEKQQKMSSHGL